ncbi:MAG: phosphoribosylformylglycinamidine synthase subunit PurQ [Proteobacteria bacterium]|nr:phosphoribosylformylglycinamidine synthase subunit PurQ [Pseudomonadota bacterium]
MKFGIIVFPGSNCDHDCRHVVRDILGHEAEFLWHKERSLAGSHCVILPGGFSYGDYLRSGAMAACSPIMDSVKEFAASGGLVIGICNGFQILQEAGLLPGVMMRNDNLKFICRDVRVRVERTDTPFTCACRQGEVLRIPIAHMDGNFFADKREVSKMHRSQQIVLRYCDAEGDLSDEYNPNGSMEAVAGVVNEAGNVLGMMPHPERCSEGSLGNIDGLKVFKSIVEWASARR